MGSRDQASAGHLLVSPIAIPRAAAQETHRGTFQARISRVAPSETDWGTFQARSPVAPSETHRGTSHQQHQHHGQHVGHSSPTYHQPDLVHFYGAFCPFRLHQIGDMWPSQGRVITPEAVRGDRRMGHGPHDARAGHRAARRPGGSPGWGRRSGRAAASCGGLRAAGGGAPEVTASVTFP
jgi:hypothetical protein